MHRIIIILCCTQVLVACASNDVKAIKEAAIVPLNDLNLENAEIPQVLESVRKQPYRVPDDYTCDSLAAEIKELDAVLGADLDTPETELNPSLIDRGFVEVRNRAIGTLHSTTQSVVPYRKWVRKLSGAERYSKKVASAINAGVVRRAFIKGMLSASECNNR